MAVKLFDFDSGGGGASLTQMCDLVEFILRVCIVDMAHLSSQCEVANA